MAKKKGGAGRVAKAVGAAAGVAAEAPPPREFRRGDLVLAKVKGWPAWPAQVERLETDGKYQGKYYVKYFGPGQQIGWCLPTELSDFDAEQKEAAIQKSQKKTADKKFISAVNEICALQDERAGIMHNDSGDENEVEDENGGSPEGDDALRDSGLDGQEDDDMTKEEGDVASGVKRESFLPQVTLNQQDDSVPFNDANPEEDVEDDAADKDWTEKPEYNGGRLDKDDRAAVEEAKLLGDAEGVDLEGNEGSRRAFRNALRRMNESAEKDPEPKREETESEGQVLTYQYGRKKNRNKNTNLDGSPVVSGAWTTGGQATADNVIETPVVETGEAQKKVKPKLGRPSKASQQAKAGPRDGKPKVQASKKSNSGDKDSKLERGNGKIGHEGGGKYAKDPSNNGHDKKGAYLTKKDIYRSSWKEGGESRERKLEDKKDVKRVGLEPDRVKKGLKKPQMSSKEEAKKHSSAPKQRDERAKDSSERNAFSGFHGGLKSKGDFKGSKRKRVIDDEGEEEGEDVSMEGERGDAGMSPKTEVGEKHHPSLKKAKIFGAEEKQKHVAVGRSGSDGGNAERDSPRDGKSRERGASLPPKADKDRMRKAALDGEAALPPSKRRNRAFAAMSACEAEAATASAAEFGEHTGNGMSGNQGVGNENVNNEGASPLKTATVTPDISESGDGGHKALKKESGHDNLGQERIDSRRHVPLRDASASDSPSKGGEEASKLAGSKLEGRSKIFKSKSGAASQNPGGHGSPGVTEKRKGHLMGSEGGKLSTSTSGGTETFPSVAKPSFDDSSIKNAVALAIEKKNALKKEADTSASMKVLIAAAQAKQRARQCSTGGSGSFGFPDLDRFTGSMVCSPGKDGNSGLASPVPHSQGIVLDPHVGWNAGVNETALMDPGVDTEATIARDTFVGMLETLSRTKDSIGRTTRQAMDCAKHSIADQIVEIIVLKLENEPSFHRRVDFWFLLDSVTQVAHTQKVAAFLPIVQEFLPRILNAAAPPGSAARENRKQCLKVLNLWLERKVMPEAILRHFMTEIESHNDVDKGAGGGGHRRLSRYERGVDDPVRDMDGMLVDEYGSNASLNLPDRFSFIPQLYEDEEEGSEDGDKKVETEPVCAMNSCRSAEGEEALERHRTILEDVDGELEMEDVSPTAESEVAASKDGERLLGGPYVEDARVIPGQPPLPLGPPPSMPSPPPLPTEPPPSPPPPPQSPPPPSTGPESPYPRTGVSMGHSQDTSNRQQSDSPSTPTGLSGHQGQGSLGLSQGGLRSISYPGVSLSQLSMPLGSPLPPTPSQHTSAALGQGGSGGLRLPPPLPPPPPLPSAYRPQRVRAEMSASPASESGISSRLARPGEEQARQGVQEASGGERSEELGNTQQDGGAAYSGGRKSSGPSEVANVGDHGSAGVLPGYASNAPVHVNQVNQDQLYRMNAGVRPGPGAQFPYRPAGLQGSVHSRPFGGHFSPHAQYQGPPMNPSGNQGPAQMLAFRPGGPTHNSWRPA